jgi:hypothetical protein
MPPLRGADRTVAVDVPRFWLALGADAKVDDHGFLRDSPRSGARAKVLSTADLDRPGAVMLVGEPGMGKTTSLQALVACLRTRRSPDEEVQLVDLGATGQEARLRESVFGTPEHARWRAGDGILHLLLDGLDEARLRVETVADLLVAGMEEADRSRLRLVVACRSGDRHRAFEERLAELFGKDAFAVFELLPLRRKDVAAIADDAGVPSAAFLREVDRQDVRALAARPITLRLLLSAAAGGQGLAGGPIELYHNGCRAWAAEHDEDRRRGVTAGRLDVGARLAVAERIAAAVVLSGRGVHADERSVADDDHVSLVALTGGAELRDGAVPDAVAVDEAAVRETLGTALFMARAHGRFAFVHQTVAEFLAASYLATRMRPAQMLDLVTLREGDGLTLVPQLREVVRWLCGLSPEILLAVLAIDPEVALDGDLSSLPLEHAAAVVDGLLRVSLRSPERRELVRRLRHPGMEEQLAAVLDDRSAAPQRRQRAIALAVTRRLSGLTGRIADLALDPAEPPELRAAAAGALGEGPLWLAEPDPPLAPDAVRLRLRPLALGTVDAPDTVRGAALRALLFDLVEPEEAFAALTPQPGGRPRLLADDWQLSHTIFELPDDRWRVAALDWVVGLPYAHRPSDPLFASVEELLIDSWEDRDDPAVHAALVRLVTRLLGGGRLLVTGQALRDETDWPAGSTAPVRDMLRDRDGRRALVRALIGALADGRIEAAAVAGSTPPLLDAGDRAWLDEQVAGAEQDGAGRAAWRRLAEALDARERRPPPARPRPVPPGAPPLDVAALVADDLARFDAGDLDAFWRLGEHLALDEDDPLAPGPWAVRSNLRRFPGWARLDEATRERVVDAAWRFLHEKDPQADGWLMSGLPWAPAMAGLRALHVLGTDLVVRLGNEVWERWAPVIMTWPRGALDGLQIEMFPTLCLVAAPSAGTDAFLEALDRAAAQSGRAWPLDRLYLFSHELLGEVVLRLERPLLDRVCDPRWPPLARGAALVFLLLHESEQARATAGTLLDADALTDPRGRAAQLELAQALVERTDDASWSSVWPLLTADAAFGHELLRRLSRGDRPAGGRLGPEAVIALVAWLDSHPPTADELRRWSEATTADRWQPAWVARTVTQLANTGTPAALDALGRLPGDWRWERDRARELVRRARWRPPQPADVVRLGADRARRWVLTDAELREVLVEALGRAQAALQAATPAAADLWDTTARRPKRENEISDWLARWLKGDLRGRGIVIGREVQIRPGPGGKMGDAGDLVVDAVAAERTPGADVVTVTIEVKGCWHRGVETALRAQLVERYLLAAGRRQGIYVVAWFPPGPWDAADRRRRDARRDLDELRALLAAQAQAAGAACDVEVDAVVLDCSPTVPRHTTDSRA